MSWRDKEWEDMTPEEQDIICKETLKRAIKWHGFDKPRPKRKFLTERKWIHDPERYLYE